MFLWPSPTRDAPVYAMEFVVFGPKPIVAVIDAVGLAGPHAAKMSQDALTAAHMRFVLPQADDPPPWYQDCRSGHDFFVRPTPEQMPTLGEAHHAVFDAVLGALLEAPGCARPEQHLASIRVALTGLIPVGVVVTHTHPDHAPAATA